MKIETKSCFSQQSIRDTVEMTVKIYNGFFHYHHEEVQYWSAVFWRVSKRDNPPAVVRQRSPEKLFIKRYTVTSIVVDDNQYFNSFAGEYLSEASWLKSEQNKHYCFHI